MYLENCLQVELSQMAEQDNMFVVGVDGELQLAPESEDKKDLLAQQKVSAQKEGIRAFNLAFRRQFEEALNLLLDKIVEQKKLN